ncbi:hypothetical protein M405DRAFT_882566 [Rhizopogon salebrosus TDB-379]|nr:hypothetical protein M405DRAFT_882566 [Rhizopogon salebrosus TDB-379]
MYAVTSTPTPSYSQSGGHFQLIATNSNKMRVVHTAERSATNAHGHFQDLVLNDDFLYTLLERQGSSKAERTTLHLAMPNKFMPAVLRPGVFSPLALRIAIEQYADACLSVAGPHPPHVFLPHHGGKYCRGSWDPQTGDLQDDRHWNALKRDSLHVAVKLSGACVGLSDCRNGNREEGIVIQRERVSVIVKENMPLTVHHYPSDSLPPELRIAVLDILWTLCDTIGYEALKNLETGIVEILRQEIAFSVLDIIRDLAQSFNFKATLDESSEAKTSITARLQGIEDLDGAPDNT